MSDRFPCISFDGQWIYTGHQDVYRSPALGGTPEQLVFKASRPKELADGRILMSRNAPGSVQDGTVLVWDGLGLAEFVPPGLEGWSCDNGLFAGWRRNDRLKAITRSSDWHTAGLVDLVGISSLEVDEVEIDRGPIYDPRYTGEMLVWSKDVRGQRRTYGRLRHGAPTEDLTVLAGNEFWPVAIETRHGPQVMNHGDEHCFMRPWGPQQYQGHIVRVGITDRPDGRELPDGRVLVAFSDQRSLQREFVDMTAPTVDVRRLSTPQPDPTPNPQPPDPPEERPVEFESKHTDVMEALNARFPAPVTQEGPMREWSQKLAEQLLFSFPGERWGCKSTRPGSTQSFDVIAREAGGRLWGYDLAFDGGASHARLNTHPQPMDLTGQAFIPVFATNHLGRPQPQPQPDPGPGPTPIPNPDPTPQPVDLTQVLQVLNILTARVTELLARPTVDVQALTDTVNGLRTFVENDGVVGRLLVLDNKVSQLLARREPERCRSPFRIAAGAAVAEDERIGLAEIVEILRRLLPALEALAAGGETGT